MGLWEQARDDWRILAHVIWKELNLPKPSRVQQDMLLYMQHGPDRQMVTAARGFAKTYLGCVAVIGSLMQDPNGEILIVSKSNEKAKEFTTMIRSWINVVPLLEPLKPKKGWRNQANNFDVGLRTIDSHSASVTAKGITSQITGSRAKRILFDDVETLENSSTVEQREKLLLKLTEGDSILHPGGTIQYNGTFQSQKSIYLDIAKMGAFDIRVWPSMYPSLTDEDNMKWLAPLLLDDLESGEHNPGDPTFPERYTLAELTKREASMGRSRFLLQFQLDASMADENRYPLKLRDTTVLPLSYDNAPADVSWAYGMEYVRKDLETFNVGMRRDCWLRPMRIGDHWGDYQEKAMYIDPSGEGQDETAWASGGILNGRIFLFRSNGRQDGNSKDTYYAIAKDCYECGIHYVEIEPNWGQGMFINLLKSCVDEFYKAQKVKKQPPHIVEGKRAAGQKELRIINRLEPAFNQHRLVVSEECVQDKKLWTQVTEITHERGCLKHDDRVEALAGLVSHFTADLDVDQEEMKKRLMEQEIWESINQFDKNRGNTLNIAFRREKPNTWFQLPGDPHAKHSQRERGI